MATQLGSIGRMRRSEDREYLRPGLCDSLIVNANQLENSDDATAAYIDESGFQYLVDPVLWRLQVPEWWRNERGVTKRNYARLAGRYSDGTSVRMADEPLVSGVSSDDEWRQITANVVTYQRDRLREQIDFFNPDGLEPSGVVAPALVPDDGRYDSLNNLLAAAAAEAAGDSVVVQVICPKARLGRLDEVEAILAALPVSGVAGYLVWLPEVREVDLLSDDDLMGGMLAILGRLASTGLPVTHAQGGYITEALGAVGVSNVIHTTGWTDSGEPAKQRRGSIRSCQTYLPGLRHTVHFTQASQLGRSFSEDSYLELYCNCTFCAGVFEHGQHPLDLLLEDQPAGTGRRRTPTGRAITANTWHYLSARRQEVEAFGSRVASEVVAEDIDRAIALVGDAPDLKRLAAVLSAA